MGLICSKHRFIAATAILYGLVGPAQAHRPLHPDRAQVQAAYAAVVREVDFRQVIGAGHVIYRYGLKASRQESILRVSDQLALAGLVEGSFSTGKPKLSVWCRCR